MILDSDKEVFMEALGVFKTHMNSIDADAITTPDEYLSAVDASAQKAAEVIAAYRERFTDALL